MANSDNGAAQAEGDSAAPIDGDDGIPDAHPAAELEVTVRPAATEVELKEMRDDLKNSIEKSMIIKTSSMETEQKKNKQKKKTN